MDVEGHEWDVLSTITPDILDPFDQIVFEAHWLDRLVEPSFESKVQTALRNVNRHFTLFHVHANNCATLHLVNGFTVASVLELSYIRTSKITRRPSTTVYPSSLNKANDANFHDLPLLFYPFLPTTAEDHQIGEMIRRLDLEQRFAN